MAEDYQERIDRRAAEYEKIKQKAFRDGFDAAIAKLRHDAGTRDPPSFYVGGMCASDLRNAANWLDANRLETKS